jgi:putative oxidoreductase
MNNLTTRFFQTTDSLAPLVLRLGVAIAMWPHGAQKLLGLYGGYGFGNTMQFFTTQAGIPAVIAFLVIIGEFFGPIALALGFFTRFSAASLALIIGAAAFLGGHAAHGFFINWFGNQKGEGIEYHLLFVFSAVALAIIGGGKWSLDAFIAGKLNVGSPSPSELALK